MFITAITSCYTYNRTSKNGLTHSYNRQRTVYVFRCDSCDHEYQRPKSCVNIKRASNNYFHVCSNCDAKRFAQKKGAERRTIWNKRASSLDTISKL